MNTDTLESLLVRALTSATRGIAPACSKVDAAAPLDSDELSTVSGGASRSEFLRFDAGDRFHFASPDSSRVSSFFEGFQFDSEGPGFVEFTEPEFVEAKPPASFPGFGGFGGFGGGLR